MLTPGIRIGPYEVVGSLGAGGMGEVYRARDTALGRDVALKILPEAFASDADRLARFDREAKTLAALNHANIAHIYGLATSAGDSGTHARALVMELVDGEDLAARIARAPLPIDEALPIARQIAEALEAAHEHGIVHRDLKPANIKVRRDGAVKVLDFGLAKALDQGSGIGSQESPQAADGRLANSPTITSPAVMTVGGMILGTAAYMSPEQARGRQVDKRADIWAFGCVLYEMLTGRRAFAGEDVTDTIVSVVSREPDWAALGPDTPPSIRRLLRRCLIKNPKERLPDIAVARLEIDEAAADDSLLDIQGRPPIPARHRSSLLPWIVTAISLTAATAMLIRWAPWRAAPPPLPIQMTAELHPDVTLTFGQGRAGSVILSPDGATMAFVATSEAAPLRLFVRPLANAQATVLAGSDGATNPFFSPDGQWVAFFADGKLKKVSVNGGAVVTLCDAPSNRGGDWSEDGTIVFSPDRTGVPVVRVSEAGGTPEPITQLAGGDVIHRWPQMLPGGRAVLYTANTNPIGFDSARIIVQPLPGGTPKTLVRAGYYGRYLPSGHLLYVQQGTLFAARFDVDRLEMIGSAVPIIENVANNSASGGAELAFSDTGTLAFVPGRTLTAALPILWVDRQKQFRPLRREPTVWSDPRFSPDGSRIATAVLDRGQLDVWIYDWTADRLQRQTAAAGNNDGPVWTPDGRRIVFASTRGRTTGSDLYWQRVDMSGQVQRLTDSETQKRAESWHPDGKRLIYTEINKSGTDLMLLPIDGDEASGWRPGKPQPFLNGRFNEISAMFSPDGRWLAYETDETGRFEVYVTPFPGPGGRLQVSTRGGLWPTWSRTRSELLFTTLGEGIFVLPYRIEGGSFVPGKQELWVDIAVTQRGGLHQRSLEMHPDGERFAVAPVVESDARGDRGSNQVTLIFNFFEMLKGRLPA